IRPSPQRRRPLRRSVEQLVARRSVGWALVAQFPLVPSPPRSRARLLLTTKPLKGGVCGELVTGEPIDAYALLWGPTRASGAEPSLTVGLEPALVNTRLSASPSKRQLCPSASLLDETDRYAHNCRSPFRRRKTRTPGTALDTIDDTGG